MSTRFELRIPLGELRRARELAARAGLTLARLVRVLLIKEHLRTAPPKPPKTWKTPRVERSDDAA